ncbi:hypothetical protein [Oscillibacter sp. 1-3]|uniref:hypothetical protein n=1 Tax=Oscillibacter sp. 1-3 TaxID=1235797 RepID=UPI0012DFD861|nr:hypothetical protein [Oscillibacter sp. 1-3]MCI9511393.1 hypothetical protein [Oscillibacter sp.]
MAKCAATRDFFADQGDLTPAYSAYGKENQRKAAEKDPSLGRFDIFQTWPIQEAQKIFKGFVRFWRFSDTIY